jgi:hypothetical protein
LAPEADREADREADHGALPPPLAPLSAHEQLKKAPHEADHEASFTPVLERLPSLQSSDQYDLGLKGKGADQMDAGCHAALSGWLLRLAAVVCSVIPVELM